MVTTINDWILDENGLTEIFGTGIKTVFTGLVIVVVVSVIGLTLMNLLSDTEDTIADAFRGVEGERTTWGR